MDKQLLRKENDRLLREIDIAENEIQILILYKEKGIDIGDDLKFWQNTRYELNKKLAVIKEELEKE